MADCIALINPKLSPCYVEIMGTELSDAAHGLGPVRFDALFMVVRSATSKIESTNGNTSTVEAFHECHTVIGPVLIAGFLKGPAELPVAQDDLFDGATGQLRSVEGYVSNGNLIELPFRSPLVVDVKGQP